MSDGSGAVTRIHNPFTIDLTDPSVLYIRYIIKSKHVLNKTLRQLQQTPEEVGMRIANAIAKPLTVSCIAFSIISSIHDRSTRVDV